MQSKRKTHTIDADFLHAKVFNIVANSSTKITPVALEKRLLEKFALNKRQIKSAIRDLVAGAELAYTYEYGSTYLEPSFAKPVRISRHIVLKPPGHHHRFKTNDVVVKIKPGASFGAGNHPTTRLAIQGIEFALLGDQALKQTIHTSVLDIGTGSGVLLITALLCGMQTGLGVDIDACARVEAAENLRINALEDRAAISGQSIADIHQRFSLILGNLRSPTLKKMRSHIKDRAGSGSLLILSGLRVNELDDLLQAYRQIRFEKIWTGSALGWSGAVLRRE